MLGTIFDKKTASKNKLLRLNYYAVFNKFGLTEKVKCGFSNRTRTVILTGDNDNYYGRFAPYQYGVVTTLLSPGIVELFYLNVAI